MARKIVVIVLLAAVGYTSYAAATGIRNAVVNTKARVSAHVSHIDAQ